MPKKDIEGAESTEEAGAESTESAESTEEAGAESTDAGASEEESTIDEKAVTALIQKSVSDAIAKKMDSVSDDIVKNFFKGVANNRKKAIDGGVQVDAKADDKTRQFIKALFAGDREQLKALSTSTSDDAKAGYAIPTELQAEVLRIASEAGVARREMRYLPFSGAGNERKIPALGTSVSVGWVGEGAKKPSTEPTFNLVTQTLKKLAAIVPMTEEILEDSAINLTQLVGQLFAEAMAAEEDAQFFAGNGSPWTGLLNNSSVNKVTMNLVASLITADDLLAMIDATPSSVLNGSKFYMHRSVLSAIRKLKSADGHYIYQSPSQAMPATIWDFPVVTVDAMPTMGEVNIGDQFVLFGNLQKGAIFGDKQQLRVKLLEEATITDVDGSTPINLAEQDMVAIRVVERVGYAVALPKAITVLEAGSLTS
jgi:HK97 family phage major capsid protein